MHTAMDSNCTAWQIFINSTPKQPPPKSRNRMLSAPGALHSTASPNSSGRTITLDFCVLWITPASFCADVCGVEDFPSSWLCSISPCGYIKIYRSVQLLMNIWVLSFKLFFSPWLVHSMWES